MLQRERWREKEKVSLERVSETDGDRTEKETQKTQEEMEGGWD